MADPSLVRPSGAGLATLLAPVRSRPYRLLWAGTSLNMAVEQFQTIALAAIVFDLSNSTGAWGLVLMATAVPRAIMLPIGGVVTDYIQPRSALILGHLSRAIMQVVLLFAAASDSINMPMILAYSLVFGVTAALLLPASNALVPQLVGEEQVLPANALISLTNTVATFVAPIAAGFLVAASGATGAFVMGAVFCSLAVLVTWAMRPPELPPSRRGSPVQEFREGLAAANRDPVLRTVIIMAGIASIGYAGATVVGLPALAKLVLFAGDVGLGIMLGAIGAGALVGTVLMGVLPVRRLGLAGVLCMLLTGVLTLPVAFTPSVWVAVPFLVAGGASLAVMLLVAIVLVQTRTPVELRGRVMALLMLGIFGLTPIAYGAAGVAGDLLGTRGLIAVSAGFILLAGMIGLFSRPMREAV